MSASIETRPMKRVLSLDGGGIRGVFSLQILRRLEMLFRQRANDEELVLADAFDMFAGTSTGAIIAAGLCWGMSVDEVEAFYTRESHRMFSRSPWFRRFWSKYRSDRLTEIFKSIFTEEEANGIREPANLGTDKLQKLLLVVVRNASTGSPWPITNNPSATFNSRDRADCNLNIPLWKLLRASTAAPTFFEPQEINIGGRVDLFIDGGVTPYNNPALLAVLQATLPQYQLNWKTGRENIHVISVGTGIARTRMPLKSSRKITLLDQITHVTPALIGSSMTQQDLLCRILGDCLYGENLDIELGPLLRPTMLNYSQQAFSYVRYDRRLDEVVSNSALPPLLQAKLDDLKTIPALKAMGKEYADQHVMDNHLDCRQLQVE